MLVRFCVCVWLLTQKLQHFYDSQAPPDIDLRPRNIYSPAALKIVCRWKRRVRACHTPLESLHYTSCRMLWCTITSLENNPAGCDARDSQQQATYAHASTVSMMHDVVVEAAVDNCMKCICTTDIAGKTLFSIRSIAFTTTVPDGWFEMLL